MTHEGKERAFAFDSFFITPQHLHVMGDIVQRDDEFLTPRHNNTTKQCVPTSAAIASTNQQHNQQNTDRICHTDGAVNGDERLIIRHHVNLHALGHGARSVLA